ncbi:hypothetical protein MLD38_000815 [Melastoma candidum]|uniref:Uncharacterized protein n=1 Tax=Melastoma candidum TaxID=119954 RepID=A0ACB9SCV8_9MYRT|nr:hypothetical protein MLD38_000815 [Melastoma candidum]
MKLHLPQQHLTLFRTLQDLAAWKDLRRGSALHAKTLRDGSFSASTVLANAVVNLYTKCDRLELAERVFDGIHHRDVVSWNCLINGYSRNGVGADEARAVMRIFRRMRSENFLPNPHTFAGVFTGVSSAGDASLGSQAHALVVKIACLGDVFVGSSMVNMYGKVGRLEDARKLFDRMPTRNSVSWATMLSVYAAHGLAADALGLFSFMCQDGEVLNEFVLTSVLSSLADKKFGLSGRQIHGLAIKNGLLCFVPVGNALVTMYVKCGGLGDAVRAFEFSNEKNSITWSAMVTGFAQSGASQEALKLFSTMHSNGMFPSEYTFVGVINACSDISAIGEGRQLHCHALKLGFVPQIFVMTALLDMYAKSGNISDARKIFDHLQEKKVDVVLWTSMISGYVQNGENENAMLLYCRMQTEGILPNELTMASILKACSSVAAVEPGKQIHARVIKYGIGLEIPVGSALATMYAKCGSLEDGIFVFRRMSIRDVLSWNAMISGHSHNGLGHKALDLFEEMLTEGIEPDSVTFVNVLSACSHIGSVDRGWGYFKAMSDDFGMTPGVEHYACMVDLLSRAGRLQEAKDFIESAQVDHGLCLWRILLGACRNHRNFKLGACAGERLMELGTVESSAFVMLSSIYTSLGQWDDVQRVRCLMKSRGVSKEPGCSWIELKDGVHVFVVGDQMHPEIDEIRSELRILSRLLKDEGYRPDIDRTASDAFSSDDEADQTACEAFS